MKAPWQHTFSRAVLIAVAALVAAAAAQPVRAAPDVSLQLFATVPGAVVDIASAGDGRLFAVERAGVIRIIQPDGTVLGTPFLSITSRVLSGGERGLLGLAFHPDYTTNGYFYVNYTRQPDGATVISRFSVSGNPNIGDDTTEQIVLTISQPNSNHNGGNLEFGPDDYLYIGMGDGGGSNDPDETGQDGNELLGKMLRIDVDGGSPYAIPSDNPFVGSAPRDEIWHFGLRNPFRFSFDRLTGDLWIADVGQGAWEEVNRQPSGSPGGENWGWDCYEGNHVFEPAGCGPIGNYDFPVHEYDHSGGNCSVIGGYVYRGSQFPVLAGHYLFADYCTGNMWTLSPSGMSYAVNPLGKLLGNFTTSTFGEAADGEVYVGTLGGSIYHVVENTPATPLECPPAPMMGCTTPAESNKALLLLKQGSTDDTDKLIWKWLKGNETDVDAFGNPLGSTVYALCIYAGTAGTIVLDADIPAGGTCGGSPCWKATGSTGFKYKSKPANAAGIEKTILKAGAAGKAKALVKGKGGGLGLSLPPSLPVRAQLINTLNECWEATYSTTIRNDGNQFKAKAQ